MYRPATATALAEDAPLRSRAFPYRRAALRAADDPDQYLDDYEKIPIEAAVLRRAGAWTILRLPMVYGPGAKQRRFAWAIEPMLAKATTLRAGRAASS